MRAVMLLVGLMACDGASRVVPAPSLPSQPSDAGVTLDNEELPDGDGSDSGVDTGEGPVSTCSSLSRTLSADAANTCWVTRGEVRCWGLNDGGQARPDRVLGDVTSCEVSVGSVHACSLDDEGLVTCWGAGSQGRLEAPDGSWDHLAAGSFGTCAWRDGDPTIACWGNVPDPPEDLGQVRKLVVDTGLGCALLDGGRVRCWGENRASGGPPDPGVLFTDLDAGVTHACALRADDDLAVCWGTSGQGHDKPPPIAFRSLALGPATSCGLDLAGQARCWGTLAGGVGDIPPDTFKRLAVGTGHVCGERTDGSVLCWGVTDELAGVTPITGATDLAVGGGHACVVVSGALVCFGEDNEGQATPPDGTFQRVDTSESHTCATTTSGGLACFGADGRGQSTPPTDGGYDQVMTTSIIGCAARQTSGDVVCWGTDNPEQGVTGIVQLAGGTSHWCALATGGAVQCYGAAGATWTTVPPGITFIDVSAGRQFSCGVDDAGGVHCWGTVPAGSDAVLTEGRIIRQVAAGADHVCVRDADNTVSCWGDASRGVIDAPAGTFVDIDGGDGFACGLRTGGRVSCWGRWGL